MNTRFKKMINAVYCKVVNFPGRAQTIYTLCVVCIFLTAGGCMGENTKVDYAADVSGCGGFSDADYRKNQDFKNNSWEEYCAREMLYWRYDAQTRTLKIDNTRVVLNCCGYQDVEVRKRGETYVVTQTDKDENQYGQPNRCGCLCVFDYSTEIFDVPETNIELSLIMAVTDMGETRENIQYQGVLPLSQGSGEIVLKDYPEDLWCKPASW